MNLRSFLLAAIVLAAASPAVYCSSNAKDEAAINASVQHLVAAANAKDLNAIMEYYVPDESLIVFDLVPPRQYVGAASYRKDWEGFLASYPGALHAEVSDWKVETEGNLAFGHGFFRTTGPDKDGKPQDVTVRITDVYKKINGKWLVVHEHVSVPVDMATGQADLSSKP